MGLTGPKCFNNHFEKVKEASGYFHAAIEDPLKQIPSPFPSTREILQKRHHKSSNGFALGPL